MKIWGKFGYALLALALLPMVQAAPVLKTRRSISLQQHRQLSQVGQPWWKAIQRAIIDIERPGAGGYSTSDEAKVALVNSFSWNERLKRPVFSPEKARPSFCSGAVYMALLSGILRWEEYNRRRAISPEAWQRLMPQNVADGIGPWGYANANGPGFALLVYRLGAGVNFTDWRLARPSDVMKIWWTDEIGGAERGHLVILVKDEGTKVKVWSSHMARNGLPGGFGVRTIPKSSIKRVMFTRITRPEAFNNATRLPDEPWLTDLLRKPATWEECCLKCGVSR